MRTNPVSDPRSKRGHRDGRALAVLTTALMAVLVLPAAPSPAYEMPIFTGSTSTVLSLPSNLTMSLARTGLTTVNPLSTLGSRGYQTVDFQPDMATGTPAVEVISNFGGCPVTTGTCTGRGTITLTFAQPLTNPVLHFAGLGDGYTTAASSTRTNFHAVLTLATSGLSMTKASGANLAVIGGNTITTIGTNMSADCTSLTTGATTVAGCGSVRVIGAAVTTVSFNITGVTVRASGTGTGALPSTDGTGATVGDAYVISVSADQDYGDAPNAYESGGAARHLVGAVRLGSTLSVENANVANSASSPNASSSATEDSDDATSAFAAAVTGVSTTYTKTIALSGVAKTGRLCGWVDFDRDSAFETGERACQNVASGQTSTTVTLTGTPASAGASYVRFRLGYTAAQVESPTGPANSGEVEDYPVTFLAAQPAIDLNKTASPTSVSAVAQVVTYTFVVTNSGNVPLTGITITDPLTGLSALTCGRTPPVTLAPGQSLICTASHAATQANIDAGSLNSVSTVRAEAPGGDTGDPADDITDTDDARVTATARPAIKLAKTATPSALSDVGEEVEFTLTATNTGNVTLSGVRVIDNLPGLSALDCSPGQPATVGPGKKLTCTATYAATQADVDARRLLNTASVTAEGPGGDLSETEDNLVAGDALKVPIAADPGIRLVKDADPGNVLAVGDIVTYTFTAINTGNVSLTGVSVTDPLVGLSPIACDQPAPVILGSGENLTCTATYAVRPADVKARQVPNTATVTAEGPEGVVTDTDDIPEDDGTDVTPDNDVTPDDDVITDTDDAPVTVNGEIAVDLVKSAVVPDDPQPGDKITYSLLATNTGKVDLADVEIVDELERLGDLDCEQDQPAFLAPGESLRCVANYVITQDDIENRGVRNVANVSAISGAGVEQVSDKDVLDIEIAAVPRIDLEKTADVSSVRVGNTITYTLRATNPGSVALTGVQITDDLDGLSELECNRGQPTTLVAGAALVCTARYVATNADGRDGVVSNTATALGTGLAGEGVAISTGVDVDVKSGSRLLRNSGLSLGWLGLGLLLTAGGALTLAFARRRSS